MPIDDSDMGCDCPQKCEIRTPWTRQNALIDVEAPDAISDDGQEVYNLLRQRGIDNLLIVGVHLNMCVLGRSFAIRQMARLGMNVVLVRDLTDTMYCSRMKPFVNHFRGTDLVIEHVETYCCPTITSVDLMGGAPFQFQDDRRSASRVPPGASPMPIQLLGSALEAGTPPTCRPVARRQRLTRRDVSVSCTLGRRFAVTGNRFTRGGGGSLARSGNRLGFRPRRISRDASPAQQPSMTAAWRKPPWHFRQVPNSSRPADGRSGSIGFGPSAGFSC